MVVFSQVPAKKLRSKIAENVIQKFDVLTMSTSKIKKALSRGNKYGTCKKAQEHGRAKDDLKSAKRKDTEPSLNSIKMMNNMARGLNETTVADETKKQILIVFTTRVLLKNKVGKALLT